MSPSDLPPPPSSHPGRPPWRLLGLLLLAAIVIVVWGLIDRAQARAALERAAADQAVLSVSVVSASPGSGAESLSLPGRVEAYATAPIYARINGYLKRWTVDIGAHVKSGQLLAEIDAPEIDQQLRQAEADLQTRTANDSLAQSTAARWQQLYAAQSVSKQDLDDKLAAAAASRADTAAARARVEQLRAQASFERVVAPFDGVVTARKTDVGALIDAGSGSGAELFAVADLHRLRIYVQVPQIYAAGVKPGLSADLHFAEYPGRSFAARLSTTANAIDPVARTLLAQFETDNDDGTLLPGGFVEVQMHLPTRAETLRLPANALLFRGQGLLAAVVDDSQHVVLKPVSVGRDFGTSLEVLDGLTAGERVIVNPPDSLAGGETVRIVAPPGTVPATPATGAKKPS